MIWPRKYFLYLMRRTAIGVIGLFFVIWMLVVSIDLIESMREVNKYDGAGFPEALKMTFYRTPQLLLTLSPFVFLFGTLWAFGQMSKSSEVAVMRAAGLSVWRIVAAPVALAFALGMVTVIAFDPIASDLSSRAASVKNEMRGKQTNMLRQFRDGVWLRQIDGPTAALIRAASYNQETQTLDDVTVWRRSIDGVFIERWDAKSANVAPNVFVLNEAQRTTLHGENEIMKDRHQIPVSIDLRALREDVAQPTALSVWKLPSFSRIMSSAGMRTTDYDIRFHELLSLPVRLIAMVLIGCAFALGMNARAGGTAALMGLGIAAGFALFIVAEFSTAIAQAQIVPIGLAAWGPAIFAVLFATTLLLYREDG